MKYPQIWAGIACLAATGGILASRGSDSMTLDSMTLGIRAEGAQRAASPTSGAEGPLRAELMADTVVVEGGQKRITTMAR